MESLIIGITGASGVIYGIKIVEYLQKMNYHPIVIISDGAKQVAKHEVGFDLDAWSKDYATENNTNLGAAVASGSYKTRGMIICPCSSKTLALVAHGLELNLISRAAMCQLKEGRPLLLVPRETPLSIPYTQNLLKCLKAGAKVIPASPGFYHQPKTLDDLINFVIGKILDQIDIPHELFQRWNPTKKTTES